MLLFMHALTSCSNHFISPDVKATGLKLNVTGHEDLGCNTIQAHSFVYSNRFKNSANISLCHLMYCPIESVCSKNSSLLWWLHNMPKVGIEGAQLVQEWSGGVGEATWLGFIPFYGLKFLPQVPRVSAIALLFKFVQVSFFWLTLWLFLSFNLATLYRSLSPALKAADLSFSLRLTSLLIHGYWFG